MRVSKEYPNDKNKYPVKQQTTVTSLPLPEFVPPPVASAPIEVEANKTQDVVEAGVEPIEG